MGEAMGTIRRDREQLQRTMDAIISESRRTSAARAQAAQASLPGLEAALPFGRDPGTMLPERIADLVFAITPRRRLDELVLHSSVTEQVAEFIDEFSNVALLRAHSLEPRHTVLLVGPPGNGKTSLAEALACELSLPLLILRYDAIVDSYLGETANRLRKLIEHATANPCVLFFDEFDAVGKERSDAQETGEIKRLVSSLLMQMDRLPSHTVVVCATNHPEMLDRAVWRRFEMRLNIDPPSKAQLETWFETFARTLPDSPGMSAQQFASLMKGESMSAVEQFSLNVRRRLVLSRGRFTTAELIAQVVKRGKLTVTDNGHIATNNANRISDRPAKSSGRRGADQG